MTSVLIGGAIVLLWVWADNRTVAMRYQNQQAVMLVFLLFSATHLSAISNHHGRIFRDYLAISTENDPIAKCM